MFKLQIETGNNAFDPSPLLEIARILRTLADDIEAEARFSGPLEDVNGNRVGNWSLRSRRR